MRKFLMCTAAVMAMGFGSAHAGSASYVSQTNQHPAPVTYTESYLDLVDLEKAERVDPQQVLAGEPSPGNSALIEQDGDGGHATIDQEDGEAGTAYIYQNTTVGGDDNVANIWQKDYGSGGQKNRARIQQTGEGQMATIQQVHDNGGSGGVDGDGTDDNYARIDQQHSEGSEAVVMQAKWGLTGFDNDAEIRQHGAEDAYAIVYQKGDGNSGYISQGNHADGAYASIFQEGELNVAEIHQNSMDAWAAVVQLGNNGNAYITQ